MSDGTVEGNVGDGGDGEVDRSALDQWLVDAGYTDEQLETMSNEEKLFALGWDSDDLADALAADGFTPEQIAQMSPDERAAAVWETIAEYEALERLGYTEDELDAMSADERSEMLSDMEQLRAAGYDPADMSRDEREEALERLEDDDPDNDAPEEPLFDDRPSSSWDPDEEDIDPYEEDPDDPEDEDLSEDEEASDAVARELEAEDDEEFDRLLEGDMGGDVAVGEGAEGQSDPYGGAPRPWDNVEETETKSEWLDERGIGLHRGRSTVATDDEYGVLSEDAQTGAELGPVGASYESSFESVLIDTDGNMSSAERGTNVDVGMAGVDLGRAVAEKTVYADGSSDERSSASSLELDPDGFDVSVANTDIRTDADGNWEGTIRSAEVSLSPDGVAAGDSIDSRADGGLLGDRGIQRDASFDLGLDGIDLSDQGSVTVGGHTVAGDFDLQLGDTGADVELGLDLDLDLELDLGGVELAPLPMPTFGMVEMPELTLIPMNDPLPTFDEVVTDVADTVNDVVDDFADNAPPPPPPPPSPDDVGDAMNDFFG